VNFFSIVCLAIAGIANGSFAVPMKGIRDWKWEHTWFVYTLFANGVFPALLVIAAGGGGALGLLSMEWRTTGLVCFYGALWGAGSVLFGLSLAWLGIAAANALVCSIVALAASLGPLLFGYAHILRAQVPMLSIGLAGLIAGIGICARSSQLRDGGSSGGHRRWAIGILIAVAAALLSSMLNIGFAAGTPLTAAAAAGGYSKLVGTLIIWIPVLAGGFAVGLAYTSYLIHRGASWEKFTAPGSGASWLRAITMSVLWFGAIAIYGFGADHVGPSGVVFGAAMTAGGSIITSNVWGVLRGEWPTAGPRRIMYVATFVLVASFCLLAAAKA